MDITTLERANELNRKIRECKETLDCFDLRNGEMIYSLNPRLIIEFEGGDGREQHPLPLNLSNELVSFIKAEIVKCRETAVSEFNAL